MKDTQAFTAIADPTRRAILRLLDDGPSNVEAIAAHFPISRPAVSKHLALLGKAGLVRCAPSGRTNVYALEREPLEAVRDWIDGFWAGRLARLKRLSEGDS